MKPVRKIFEWLLLLMVIIAIGLLVRPMAIYYASYFRGDYTTRAILQLILISGAVLLAVLAWTARMLGTSQSTEDAVTGKNTMLSYFVIGLLISMIGIASFNIIIDPWDLYGMKVFPSRVNPARRVKLEQYLALTKSPELIVTGSSAAFAIDPSYIEETLGLDAFNWAFNAGEPPEIAVLLKYIALKTDTLPEVVVLQLKNNGKFESLYNQVPIQMLPYLPPLPLVEQIGTRFSELFSIHQLTDSIYTYRAVTIMELESMQKYYYLEDGKRYYDDLSFSEQAMEVQLYRTSNCKEVPQAMVKGLDDIIAIIDENNSSLIIYISPFFPGAYEEYLADNADFQYCNQVIVDHMASLAESHENVFFKNYTFIADVNGIADETGFMDAVHITPENANLLIDAMSETILEAYNVATEKRSSEGGVE